MNSWRTRIMQDKVPHRNKCKRRVIFGIRIVSNFSYEVRIY
jgi:hypothetical protein